MIDLHTHILPGLDDGAHTWHECIETLKTLFNQGCKTVICTPHISPKYPNTESGIKQKLSELKEALSESLDLTVLYGAEYSFETLFEKVLKDEPLIYINANSSSKKYLLVEFPFLMKPLWLDKLLDRLTLNNTGIMIAHPERCGRIDVFKDITQNCDCLFAINCSSVLGDEGMHVRNNAFSIISQYFAKIVFASDAHPALHRCPQFDKVVPLLQKKYSPVIVNYWFRSLPQMIVQDKKISESEERIIRSYAGTIQK